MDSPKITVLCLAYNHAPYIKDALEGFVSQKTRFSFEVIVHDDASTDGTADIIREYARRYPEIIKPVFQKENQYSRGVAIGPTFCFPLVRGEYVALCEGDDYPKWTFAPMAPWLPKTGNSTAICPPAFGAASFRPMRLSGGCAFPPPPSLSAGKPT